MTLSTMEPDQGLVEAARGGDDRAFELLYARYRPQIRGFAQRLTHDHDRAEDITQEVFLSALRRLRATDRPIAFRPWIYEIARNACIDEHRRSQRVREVPIERDGETLRFEQAFASSPPPEVAVESKQLLDDLRGAFRGLSERHHRVIVLRELEGRSYSEIGDELGISKMVVESTLFRARRRLTEEYEDLASGRRCEYVQRLVADGMGKPISTLGLRDRRALSRHLEHCRSCRREAYAAGWAAGAKPRFAGKAAVLLPIPILRLPSRIAAKVSGLLRGAHHTAALPSASVALQYGQLAPGRAVATAATVLAAVVGGGIAGGVVEQSGPTRAGPARVASSPRGGARGLPAGLSAPGATILRWTDAGPLAGPNGLRRTGSGDGLAVGYAGAAGPGASAASSAGLGSSATGTSDGSRGSAPAAGASGRGGGAGTSSSGAGGIAGASGSGTATAVPTGVAPTAAGSLTPTPPGAGVSQPVEIGAPSAPPPPPTLSTPSAPPPPSTGSGATNTPATGSAPSTSALAGTVSGTLPALPGG